MLVSCYYISVTKYNYVSQISTGPLELFLLSHENVTLRGQHYLYSYTSTYICMGMYEGYTNVNM